MKHFVCMYLPWGLCPAHCFSIMLHCLVNMVLGSVVSIGNHTVSSPIWD